MKKLFLFYVLAFFFVTKSNSQCLISFNDLDKSTNYTFSEFETFALNNGYSYDSQKSNYMCDIEYMKDAHLSLTRFKSENGFNVITHVFFQKSNYLDYKSILETDGKLNSSNTDNNTLSQSYMYNNKLIMLQTRTYNGINIYILAISNEI